MMWNDALGSRMKSYYEEVSKYKLTRRNPVIVRIDGKSFHTFTKGFMKPFDEALIKTMQDTMMGLCKNVQGCVLGYQQSDEISLLLIDYKRLESQAFFDNEIQKICSVTASMATMFFNKVFTQNCSTLEINNRPIIMTKEHRKLVDAYRKAIEKGALFDSRCFNIPKEEVTNYFYWRQLDAIRNSVQMAGQAKFSHKELYKKSRNQIQEMLRSKYGINWDEYPTYQKRGSCCVKSCDDGNWVIDNEIPVFVDDGRNYVDDLVFVDCGLKNEE